MINRFAIFLIGLLASFYSNAQVTVENLRCEMRENPQGIDQVPRFSWQLRSDQREVTQEYWQILVATSREKLNASIGDCWNSGWVIGSSSILQSYKGDPLKSDRAYFWKVKVKTNKGETAWSKVGNWSMGLLSEHDWLAKWIGYDKSSSWDSVTQWSRLSARYFRKSFESKDAIKRATVYIAGLGLYELLINGKRIGDQVLAPAPTDYRKSVFYNTHDVTSDLKSGKNIINVVLGNGRFFTMRQNYKTQKHNTFGYPKLRLQLEIEYWDGRTKTVVSDQTWKLNVDGPIRTNNEYDGEEYDANKELKGWMSANFNDSKWLKPELVKAPEGKLIAQPNPPMRIMQTINPVSIKNLGNGKYILDMGQNFSGWLKLNVEGKKGDAVQMRFAESLQANGELYVANLRDARVTDIYTLKGGGKEEWQPSFVYHGFRYVEIKGYPGVPTIKDFEGKLIYDDLQTTGTFQCSDSIINKIVRNAWWGIASNYKGMPVDCPQRNERQPWLGDRATGSGGEAYLFDNSTLYAKWLDDIEESQTPEGAIPDVAPAYWNYYSDNVTWPGTYLLVADMLYRQYGDDRPIKKHYASMKKWMKYMQTKYMKNYIVTKDKYGDWCVPPESLELIRSKDSLRTTDGQLISTAYYFHFLGMMKKFADISDKSYDKAEYEELAKKIQQAFQQKFYNPVVKAYDNNTITANLLPLYFGITPESERTAVFQQIYNRITVKDNMHISTGVIGTQWLMRGLTDYGKADVAFALASTKSYPSWGYMTEQGATTIWELWNGNTANPQMNSQNHVMLLGDFLIWLYEDIAGINPGFEGGYKGIKMQPSFMAGLNEVNASYQSIYGPVTSHWRKAHQQLQWNITIPSNSQALIYIPGTDSNAIMEGKVVAANSPGVKLYSVMNGNVIYILSSGSYQFSTTLSK